MTLNGEVVGTIGAEALAKACGVPNSNALGASLVLSCFDLTIPPNTHPHTHTPTPTPAHTNTQTLDTKNR